MAQKNVCTDKPMSKNIVISDRSISIPSLERLEQIADQADTSDPEILLFFKEEALGELSKIELILQAWYVEGTGCPSRLNDLRVSLHTLKGAANSVGQMRIGSLTGGLKDILDHLKPAQAVTLCSDLTKITITVMEAIKMLLLEATAPQYNRSRKELILQAANSILDFQKKIVALNSSS
jgi:chemotaxis protein histidine kinase CheA